MFLLDRSRGMANPPVTVRLEAKVYGAVRGAYTLNEKGDPIIDGLL